VEPCRRKCIRKFKEYAVRNKTLIDACAGQHARSYIFLDSRHVVVSPIEKKTVMKLMSHVKGNQRSINQKAVN